ncbi:hypothetical protein ACFRQM_15685 [Streptomyces sp. NPDC056831]|uniref:hypothetical protein n=1 Tax=Streptomyces sp. NPDC056831 TaxID=3345954 RepID=UPI0036CBEB11
MHDIRIRGIAGRATDHGRLKITLTQLWYLSRTRNYACADPDPLARGSAGGRAVERPPAAPPPGPRHAHTNGFLTRPPAPQTPRARDTGRPGTGASKKEGTSSA